MNRRFQRALAIFASLALLFFTAACENAPDPGNEQAEPTLTFGRCEGTTAVYCDRQGICAYSEPNGCECDPMDEVCRVRHQPEADAGSPSATTDIGNPPNDCPLVVDPGGPYLEPYGEYDMCLKEGCYIHVDVEECSWFCSEEEKKPGTQRFFQGLSTDQLPERCDCPKTPGEYKWEWEEVCGPQNCTLYEDFHCTWSCYAGEGEYTFEGVTADELPALCGCAGEIPEPFREGMQCPRLGCVVFSRWVWEYPSWSKCEWSCYNTNEEDKGIVFSAQADQFPEEFVRQCGEPEPPPPAE